MIKYFTRRPLRVLAGLMMAVMTVSCGSDDENGFDIEATMGGNPIAVAWTSEGMTIDTVGTSCSVKFNTINRRVTIEANGTAAMGADQLIFESVDYGMGQDGHSYVVNTQNLKASNAPLSVTMKMMYSGERTINSTLCNGVSLRMASEQCDLTFVPRHLIMDGATETVLTTVSDSAYVSESTTYSIDIDPAKLKAQVVVHRPKFAANMPALGDMVFPGIDVEFVPGGFRLAKDSLVPMLDGTPYPNYIITNFRADCDMTSPESTIEFNCMRVFKVYAKVSSNFAPGN